MVSIWNMYKICMEYHGDIYGISIMTGWWYHKKLWEDYIFTISILEIDGNHWLILGKSSPWPYFRFVKYDNLPSKYWKTMGNILELP